IQTTFTSTQSIWKKVSSVWIVFAVIMAIPRVCSCSAVFISASRPAPPEGSNHAILSTAGRCCCLSVNNIKHHYYICCPTQLSAADGSKWHLNAQFHLLLQPIPAYSLFHRYHLIRPIARRIPYVTLAP